MTGCASPCDGMRGEWAGPQAVMYAVVRGEEGRHESRCEKLRRSGHIGGDVLISRRERSSGSQGPMGIQIGAGRQSAGAAVTLSYSLDPALSSGCPARQELEDRDELH